MNAVLSVSTSKQPSRPRRRGFTLIEVLVASGVTVVLVGFMVAIVSNVTGFWSRTSGRLSAESQARYALDQLTLDLQSAIYRDDGATWLAASVPANTNGIVPVWVNTGAVLGNLKPSTAIGTTNPALTYGAANIANATFGPAGTWLRFFTSKRGANTDVTTLSAPVAVGWRLIRRASATNTANIDRRYFLHRAEATPTNTLISGYDITAASYVATQGANNGALGTSRSISLPVDVGTIIAENVIDFGVYFYTRPAAGATSSAAIQVFPAAKNAPFETTHFAKLPPRTGALIDQFPEEAEIMIRVLTDEGAAQIAAFETGRLTLPAGRSAAQYWWDIAVAKSQVFTRRVVLRAQPL